MIHLDTGFLIKALVRDSAEDLKLRSWLRTRTQVGMSSIAWAEFLCGPVETNDVDLAARIIQDRVPFVDETRWRQLDYSILGVGGVEPSSTA